MCGICGVFRTDGSSIDDGNVKELRSIASLMESRGPDSQGQWAHHICAMEFRRLAILDLSENGNQPLITQDGRYVLVMNGEIYNFEEIRDGLNSRGVAFRSSGDAEVALYALATYGKKALEQFNGMFALAFYDTKAKMLLLARDHAGIKPLYLHQSQKGVLFASQFDQILKHPWTKEASLSGDAISLYLRFGYIPAPFGALQGSEMLEPGCWVEFDSTGESTRGEFYTFERYVSQRYRGREAVEAVHEVVRRAVKRHLISDVPVGVFLSGGIDSPLVSAEAQKLSEVPLEAFSIGVYDSNLDEASDAVRYATEFGLRHRVEYLGEDRALDVFDDVIRACSEPSADFSIFPTFLVSKIASDHVKVILSGDGGDEPFFGYPSRMGSPIRQASHFAESPISKRYSVLKRKLLNAGTATREILHPTIGDLCLKKQTIVQPGFLENVFPDLRDIPTRFNPCEFSSTDQDEVAQFVRWLEFKTHLPRVLLKVDRASMAHSLEVRVPLLDKEVLSVAQRIAWDSCLDLEAGIGKIPLRECLRKHVGYQSPVKRGFTVPIARWLTSSLRERFQDSVVAKNEIAGLQIDSSAVTKYFAELKSGRQDVAWSLWSLFMLSEWQDTHYSSRRA